MEVKAVKSQTQTANDVSQASAAASSGLTSDDLKTLKAPFPKERLGVKVQSFNRERTRAMLVLYLQHTDVQDRIEEVDPAWGSEVVGEERSGDTVYVRCRLTIKGVTRENVGEGGDPKAAYSDALKRAAMLFGVGRYLYDSPTVWTEYDDSRDRFRQWSVDDYEGAIKSHDRPKKSAPASSSTGPAEKSPEKSAPTAKGLKTSVKGESKVVTPKAPPASNAAPGNATRPREELNRVLMNLYRPYLAQFPETQFSQVLQQRYNVAETRLMTVEQLEDLVQFLETRLRSVA